MYQDSLNGDHEAWHRLVERYPLSPQGQLHFTRDVIDIVKNVVNGKGKGVFYWAPEWRTPPDQAFVDEGDAEPCWARALFDDEGHALPALHVFDCKEKPNRRVLEMETKVQRGSQKIRKV